MIDMGFEFQVMGVLDVMFFSNLKSENEDEEFDEKRIYRIIYMFSVIMLFVVERFVRKYLRNFVVVIIGIVGKVIDFIIQYVIMMKGLEKIFRLQKFLDDLGDKIVIVFVNIKKNVDVFFKNLDKAGYRVIILYGGKFQE